MSAIQLSAPAQCYLNAMDLSAENRAIVIACVTNYEIPHTICDMFLWLVHWIVNTVKSIFGASEWQTTLSLVQNHIVEIATAKNLIDSPSRPLNERIKLNEYIFNQAAWHADRLLSGCHTAQEEYTFVSPELTALEKEWHADHFIDLLWVDLLSHRLDHLFQSKS